MIALDLPPQLILPERPAIIRPAEPGLLKRQGFGVPAGMFKGSDDPLQLTAVIAGAQANGITGSTRLAGSQAGDVLLIVAGGDQAALSAPFSTTQLRAVGSTSRVYAWAKLMDGTESGSTYSRTGLVFGVGVWRPNRTIASIVDNDTGNGQATSGDPAAQTINAASGTPPVIAFGAMKGTADVSDSVSPAMDRYATGTWEIFHFKLYNSSPQNHTYNMPDEGNNAMLSGYLTFTV